MSLEGVVILKALPYFPYYIYQFTLASLAKILTIPFQHPLSKGSSDLASNGRAL